MIEDQYSVNIYFLAVFDINLDVTLCSLLAAGFSAVPVVFLVEIRMRNVGSINVQHPVKFGHNACNRF